MGKLAGLSRTRPPDDPELVAAKIGMLAYSSAPDKIQLLTAALRQVIAMEGPLTPAERGEVIGAIVGTHVTAGSGR